MADWSLPTLTSFYTDVLAYLMARDVDSATLGYGGVPTNIPTNFIRANSSTNRLERWDGAVFQPLFATWNVNISGNANYAATAGTAGSATNISAYTINQNLGTGNNVTFNSATLSGLVVVGDSYSYRSGGTTGVLYLNSAATRYLYNDGTNYVLPGQELYINGSTALTDTNISQRGISVKQSLTINKPNSTYGNYIYGTYNGVTRWAIAVGEWSSGGETGGNVGSDFTISRYSDTGAWLGFIINSERSTGSTWYGSGGGLQYIYNARIIDGGRALARDANNGGIFGFEKPSASSLAGAEVSIDIYNNQFRVFERGGSYRGFFVDLTTCAASVGTRFWHSDSCYITPDQTFTLGGGYSFTHGLGRIPKLVQIEYECVNADSGFSPGHRILVPVAYIWSGGGGTGPQPQAHNSTSISFRMGNHWPGILNADTGTAVGLTTLANWKWRAYVWA